MAHFRFLGNAIWPRTRRWERMGILRKQNWWGRKTEKGNQSDCLSGLPVKSPLRSIYFLKACSVFWAVQHRPSQVSHPPDCPKNLLSWGEFSPHWGLWIAEAQTVPRVQGPGAFLLTPRDLRSRAVEKPPLGAAPGSRLCAGLRELQVWTQQVPCCRGTENSQLPSLKHPGCNDHIGPLVDHYYPWRDSWARWHEHQLREGREVGIQRQ